MKQPTTYAEKRARVRTEAETLAGMPAEDREDFIPSAVDAVANFTGWDRYQADLFVRAELVDLTGTAAEKAEFLAGRRDNALA